MYNLNFLGAVRSAELDELAAFIPVGARVLEFGAGTGEQAKMLSERGFDVVAIDLQGGAYSNHRVFPVTDYDGGTIPLPDKSIDVVFSSNVLEHVEDLQATLREFRRILKRDGIAVHAMPTPAWRFWTFLTGIPTAAEAVLITIPQLIRPPRELSRKAAFDRNAKAFIGGLLPIGHGISSEGISELWTFSAATWRRTLETGGFELLEERPVGLFYTGHTLLGPRLSMTRRKALSRYFGSAARIYVAKSIAGTGTEKVEGHDRQHQSVR